MPPIPLSLLASIVSIPKAQNSFPVLTQRDRELTLTGPSTFIVIFK